MTAAMGFETECVSVQNCPQAREGQCQRNVLSRLPLPEYPMEVTLPGETVMLLVALQSTPVNAKQIAEWMAKNPVLSKVKKWLSQGWTNTDYHGEELRPYRQCKEELSLQDGCIL